MTKGEFVERAFGATKEDLEDLYCEITGKIVTEKGMLILSFLKDHSTETFASKEIGGSIDMNSRSVSGSMRKLVSAGYVEKIDTTPKSYKITELGISFLTN